MSDGEALDAEVERVARLLCRAQGRDPDEPFQLWDETLHDFVTKIPWHYFRERASRMVVMATLIAEQMKRPDLPAALCAVAVTATAIEEASE